VFPAVPEPAPGVVVMMCGLAGSGKTTYALGLAGRGYLRLSVDEVIWRRLGRDLMLLDPAEREHQLATAEHEVSEELIRLVTAKKPVVLDMSFWNRAARDRYKALIEMHGGTWRLIYLKAGPGVLRRRLAVRNAQGGPNNVTVSAELLDRYLAGFEEPCGEGEHVIVQS
jgi:predicted kinase